jgi:hypothetical protein
VETEVRATLVADASAFTNGMRKAEQALAGFDNKASQTNSTLIKLSGIIGTITAATALFGRRAFQAATDLDEMVITMNAVGAATGIGSERISEAARAIEAMGIEMAESRRIAVQFAQNQLDLAQAAGLARVAQDLAVVSQSNSTQTLQRLVRGVMTGNSIILRGAGITTQAGEAYKRYAAELGVAAGSLNAAQRQQAIINAILEEGTRVAGAYEASMDNAGKVLRSFPRILTNIRIAFGNTLLTGLNPLILGAYRLTQSFAEAINITPKLNKETGEVEEKVGGLVNAMRALETVFTAIMAPMTNLLGRMRDFVTTVQVSEEQALRFANRLAPLVPVITSVAAAMSALAATTLLKFIPGFRMFAGVINPGVIAFLAFVATSTQVQEALGSLWEASRPVIEAAKQVAVVVAELALTIATQVVPAILGLLQGLLTVIKPLLDWMAATEAGSAVALGLVVALLLLKAGLGTALLGAITRVTAAKLAMAGAAGTAKVAVTLLGNAIRIALIKTGIGIAIVALGALVAWFAKSWAESQRFRDIVVDVANKIVGAFEWIINTMIRMFPLFTVLYSAFYHLRKVVTENFDRIREWFIEVRNKWREFVERVRSTVRPMVEAFASIADNVIGASEAMANAWIRFQNIIRPDWLKKPQVEFGRFARSIIKDAEEVDKATSIFDKLVERLQRPGSDEDLARQAEIAAMMAGTMDTAAGAVSRLADQLRRVNQVAYEFGRWALEVVDMRDPIAKATDEIAYQFDKFTAAMEDASSTADDLVQGFSTLASTIRSQLGQALAFARQELARAQQAFDDFANAIQTSIVGVINFGVALQAGSGLVAAFESLRGTVGASLSGMLEFRALATAPQSRQYVGFVKALADALGELGDKVEDSFLGRLRQRRDQIREFGEAIQQLSEMGISEAALRQITGSGYEAGLSMARELISGGQDAISEVNSLVDNVMSVVDELSTSVADKFYGAGGKTGSEFVDGLMEQAEKAKAFAERIRRLIEMGLEPAAIRQVLAAGYDAGSRIADELIAGGTTVVGKVNEMYKAVEKVAKDTGQFGARTFFQAGVDIAQAMIDGILRTIQANDSLLSNMLGQIAAKLRAMESQSAAAAEAAARKAITVPGGVTRPALPALPPGLNWGSGGLPYIPPNMLSAPSVSPSSTPQVYDGFSVVDGMSSPTNTSIVINQNNTISSSVDMASYLTQQEWLIRQALR